MRDNRPRTGTTCVLFRKKCYVYIEILSETETFFRHAPHQSLPLLARGGGPPQAGRKGSCRSCKFTTDKQLPTQSLSQLRLSARRRHASEQPGEDRHLASRRQFPGGELPRRGKRGGPGPSLRREPLALPRGKCCICMEVFGKSATLPRAPALYLLCIGWPRTKDSCSYNFRGDVLFFTENQKNFKFSIDKWKKMH